MAYDIKEVTLYHIRDCLPVESPVLIHITGDAFVRIERIVHRLVGAEIMD